MKLFDSHCHLDDSSYDEDFEEVLERARTEGVSRAMIVGVTVESSIKAVRLAGENKGLCASVGIHPHDAKQCSEESIRALSELARDESVRAWGEIGLDFNRMHSPAKVQEKWFIRQLEAADELNLPLIFHERDSGGRMLEILESCHRPGLRGVVHCFSGTREEMLRYLDLGLHIGITGILTIKGRGKYLRSVVPEIPLERVLVETDAPYLTPAPQKNKVRRNEPAFVKSTLLKLASVRGDDPELLADQIWNSTCSLFGMELD